ncbi:MAG: GNAT family N-acetyltransferase [Gammaproteobacteria bacterium]|nr:GNAT family N-acetyltransferase [Gammaproteobacteria bacterium]
MKKWASREMLDFQWCNKVTGELIGKGGFHHIDWAIPKFEIGYWLSAAHIGQGYCTEAVQGLVDFAKSELNAARLEIRSQPSNTASRAVAERAGFILEGINRHALVGVDGSLVDACMYALVVK